MNSLYQPALLRNLVWAVLATAGAYLLAFSIQINWLSGFDRWFGISAFFLPHGVRVLSAMILRQWSIPGLFVGSLVRSIIAFGEISWPALLAALCSATFPYASVYLLDQLLGSDRLLVRLNVLRFALIVLVSGLANSVSTTILFSSVGRIPEFSLARIAVMWSGDILGACFLIALLWGVVRFARQFILRSHRSTQLPTPQEAFEATGLIAGGLIVLHFVTARLFPLNAEAIPGIFLPAAIWVLAMLRYRALAIPGLILGMLSVDSVAALSAGTLMVNALTGTFSVFAALWVWETVRGHRLVYSDLRLQPVFELILLTSALHGLGIALITALSSAPWGFFEVAIAVALSDILGASLLTLPVIWANRRFAKGQAAT